MSEKTINVYQNTISQPRPCNGPTCRDQIVWAELMSGRKMCFTAPIEPLRVYQNTADRAIAVMPFERNHWATCPDKQKFKKGKP